MYSTRVDRDSILKSFVEISLPDQENFLKIKETLTRIGIASRKENTLWQSCHIFHKQGKFYIVHFKELFALDGKSTSLDELDLIRRNTIAGLLQQWGLLTVIDSTKIEKRDPTLGLIKVLSHSEKSNWKLETKYNIGRKK